MAVTIQTIAAGAVPDVFQLMSTNTMKELSNNISRATELRYRDMFGNSYDHTIERQMFTDLLKTANDTVATIINTAMSRTFMRDTILCINDTDKLLAGIPKIMEEIIMTTPVLRQALINDEIWGFGINPNKLPTRDPWYRKINNGHTSERGIGYAIFTSDDPDYTIEDLEAISDTREYLVDLYHAGYDPTDFPNRRGNIR